MHLNELVRKYVEIQRLNGLDTSELYKPDGTMKHPIEWPKDWRAKQSIRSLDTQEVYEGVGKEKKLKGYVRRVGMTDYKALESKYLDMIGRHIGVGAWADNTEAPTAGGVVQVAVVYVGSNNGDVPKIARPGTITIPVVTETEEE